MKETVWLYIEKDRNLDTIGYSVYSTKDKAIEARGEPDFYSQLLVLKVQ